MLSRRNAAGPARLGINAQEAAAAFIAAGIAANIVRSYGGSAWLQLRYGQALGDAPLSAAVPIQFVLDHLSRPLEQGARVHLLPSGIDAALIAAQVKAKAGPLAFNTISYRLAVLGKWLRFNEWASPTETPVLKTLLRKAQALQSMNMRKKTAIVLEPLQALLDTSDDGVHGIRDRALLLLARIGGGRRSWEVWGGTSGRCPPTGCFIG